MSSIALPAWLWPVVAFLVGSIPFGVLVARTRKVDLRQHGSGNIGATNAARVMGVGPGLVVLVLDTAKGAGPVWLAAHSGVAPTWLAATAFAAIAGHCFSPWLRFRGGKGVATALGVYLVLAPWATLVGMIVFAAVVAAVRVVAVASLAGSVAIAVSLLASAADVSLQALGVAIVVLLAFTHRSNLRRLIERAPRDLPPP